MKQTQNPLLNYENKWVAISKDYSKVIESADKPQDLEKKLTKQKIKNVILMKIDPFKYFSP